jgi:hypothetical protein
VTCRPLVPAATTVTILYGSIDVPEPVTAVWLTGVQAVLTEVAEEPAGTYAGPYRVPALARKVPQAVDPYHSPSLSPVWFTEQLRSVLIPIAVSGPADVMSVVLAPAAWADKILLPANPPNVKTTAIRAAIGPERSADSFRRSPPCLASTCR